MRDFLSADPEMRAQRESTLIQLGHAYALVRRLVDMDAARVNEFICALLEDGAAADVDELLSHIDVCAGAWRELADQADRVIEDVAAALTRALLERAVCVEAGCA